MTYKINGCAFKVSNTLGPGFVEKVYENALAHELRKAGLDVKQQHPIKVHYEDIIAGDFVADLLVNDSIIIELKAIKEFDEIHTAIVLNYLKATRLTVCLLMNFAKPKVDIKRVVRDF